MQLQVDSFISKFAIIAYCLFVLQIGADIQKFEKVFEDMEVKTGEMDAALENVYGNTISQDEVSGLLQEIQNEAAMNADSNVGVTGVGLVDGQPVKDPAGDMQNRMDELKNL